MLRLDVYIKPFNPVAVKVYVLVRRCPPLTVLVPEVATLPILLMETLAEFVAVQFSVLVVLYGG